MMNNSTSTTSIKQGEKGFVDSAAELAKDAKNMIGDIVDITKETITEKAHESKMQKPEDKGVTGLAAEFAKGVGDMVNNAVEGTKEIVADTVGGTKEIIAAHNPNVATVPAATVANVQSKPLTSTDAALVKELQEQHGDDVEITITKVTVKGLAGNTSTGSTKSGDSASELVHDARTMINNAVNSGSVTAAGSADTVPAPSVTDSAKEFAKNVRDVITDAFQNTKDLAAEKGLGDSASKLASDVKATVGNAVEATKEKVSQAADQLANHLTDAPPNAGPLKTETMIEIEKKTA